MMELKVEHLRHLIAPTSLVSSRKTTWQHSDGTEHKVALNTVWILWGQYLEK